MVHNPHLESLFFSKKAPSSFTSMYYCSFANNRIFNRRKRVGKYPPVYEKIEALPTLQQHQAAAVAPVGVVGRPGLRGGSSSLFELTWAAFPRSASPRRTRETRSGLIRTKSWKSCFRPSVSDACARVSTVYVYLTSIHSHSFFLIVVY